MASLLIAVSAAAIWALALRTPTGFLPEEDQGAFFVIVQLPDGASVSRTGEAVSRVEPSCSSRCRRCDNVFAIIGFSILDGANEPNAAFIVPLLKPFADRSRRGRLGAGADRPSFRARASRSAAPM